MKKVKTDKQMVKQMRRRKNLISGAIWTILLILADQLTKHMAYSNLRLNGPLRVIPGVFHLQYLENRGAAFGMLRNNQWIFVLFALVILVLISLVYLRLSGMSHRFRPLRIVCVLIAAGAVGNMIDRLAGGYVIDFLYVKLINFPIFNLADMYVVIGSFVALLLLIACYKEDDLNAIARKQTRADYVEDIIDGINQSRKHEDR